MYLKRIKELRGQAGLSKKEVSDYLGVKVRTYNKYEKVESKIKIIRIISLANLYNTSVDYILEVTDEIQRHF